jgi:hypothetical protein
MHLLAAFPILSHFMNLARMWYYCSSSSRRRKSIETLGRVLELGQHVLQPRQPARHLNAPNPAIEVLGMHKTRLITRKTERKKRRVDFEGEDEKETRMNSQENPVHQKSRK